MYQTYPNYFQAQTQPTSRPMQLGLKGRPVSSLDEVRGSSIDFDGSVFFFPDLANKRIYTKQINMDGTATLKMYELATIPLTNEANASYVTRDEFEQAIAQIRGMLQPQAPPKSPSDIVAQF